MIILTTGDIVGSSFNNYIKNFIKNMIHINKKIYLVVLNSSQLTKIKYTNKKDIIIISLKKNYYKLFPLKLIEYLRIQLTLTIIMIKFRRSVSIAISVMDGTMLIFPILVAKFVGINTLLVVTGPTYLVIKKQIGKLFSLLCYVVEMTTLFFTGLVIIESPSVINYYGNFNNIKTKVLFILPRIDIESFSMEKKLNKRKYHIGYVGRLETEKGIINFIYALKIIKKNYINSLKNFRAIIIGSGSLEKKIKNLIKDNNLENLINLPGFIAHETLSDYLNDIKLLVCPSYHEGVPRIVLESMACGTPILATRVGGIPDILKDGENGFLLTINEPEEIANRIFFLLKNPTLLKNVSKNILIWINEYQKDLLAKKWEIAINRLLTSKTTMQPEIH